MKRLPPAPLVVSLLYLLSATACGGREVEPPAGITPLSELAAPTESGSPGSTPTRTAPAVLPTVSLPEIKSLDQLSADVTVPTLPAAFAPPAKDAALEALVRSTLSGYQGSYSLVVRNLEDGRSASLGEGRVYYAASLYKLAVLLEAYRQRDAGETDFSQLLTLEQKYVEHDFGTLELLDLKAGDTLTLADALKAMIIVSDTPTAVMVQDVVNPLRVDQTLRSLGIKDMSVMTTELPTTARDMALLMEAVASGQGVTADSRREMLALLLQESIPGGVPAGVPPSTAVAHKTGSWTGATHDVALVWGPAGPFIIAVLSDRSWDWEPIAAVSRAVWDYFAAHP